MQNEPPAHVALNRKKVFESDAPWRAWRCLEHESAELGMEYRCRLLASASPSVHVVLSIVEGMAYSGLPRARSGTPPPCLRSSASLANASRMSACLRESLTSFSWSLKFTTRYSIWPGHQRCPHSTPLSTLPYLVAPQQSIALLSFCVAPNCKQLLPHISESSHRVRSVQSCIPRCPIFVRGSPFLSLQASREAFQWLCNMFRQRHTLILASASHAGNRGTRRTANP